MYGEEDVGSRQQVLRGSEVPCGSSMSAQMRSEATGQSALMISSGSKWSESKCNESSRISISASAPATPCLLSCELEEGRADMTVDDALDIRDEDAERIAAESIDAGRERDWVDTSSESVGGPCGKGKLICVTRTRRAERMTYRFWRSRGRIG